MTINRPSGFDPADNICWQFCNPGDREQRCGCPACSNGFGKRSLAFFGRCRSGKRWFWSAQTLFNDVDQQAHGIADTEAEAIEAAMAAVRGFHRSVPTLARINQGFTSRRLKELNAEKRRAKPPPKARGAHNVEYIWSWSRRYRIIKRTRRRIYYWRTGERLDENFEPYEYGDYTDTFYAELVGILDRQRFESGTDEVYNHLYFHSREALLAERERHRFKPKPVDLAALKAEMAAAHPDKGGSSAAFIEARQRYVAARRACRAQAHE